MHKSRQFPAAIKAWVLALLLIFPIILSGCGETEKSNSSSNIKESQSPAMWEVTSKDGATKLYLFGSIHAADDSAYPLDQMICDAFVSSEYLAVEADIVAYENDSDAQIETANKCFYSDGTTIKDHISKETYEMAKKALEDAGMYDVGLDKGKPFVWYSLLQGIPAQKLKLDLSKGLDKYFLNEAKNVDKKILEVESIDFQLNMLLDFSDDIQDFVIKDSTQIDTQTIAFKELYSSWSRGDMESLEKSANDYIKLLSDNDRAACEKYNKAFLTDRNVGMVEKAEQYLSEGKNTFFVVGAMHMIGSDGIVELLKQKGYTVNRVL